LTFYSDLLEINAGGGIYRLDRPLFTRYIRLMVVVKPNSLLEGLVGVSK
jgi:hypothetical protein